MEDYIPMSDFDKEQNIRELMEFVHRGDDKCCFCGSEMGALIHLHQGWCCVKCFKEIVLKPEVENNIPLAVKQEGGRLSPHK